MHIKVLVRVRPLLQHEVTAGHTCTMLNVEPRQSSVTQDLHSGGRSSYAVDHVCSTSSTQDEVFHHGGLQGLIDAVIQGYNSTVFAYGQTGSGKTFTMEGYEYGKTGGRGPHASFDTAPERLGITPRSVHALFSAVERYNASASEGDSKLRVMCHFVQIYKEAVLDLLNPSSAPPGHTGAVVGLKIRWCAEKQFYIDNLFTEEVCSADEALALFQKGVGNKRVAETRMNAASSRSHCIFTLTVQQMDPARPEHVQAEGRLTLVDLAGSERQQALVNSNDRAAMADSVQINKSLFTLRKVIIALSEASTRGATGKAHIPYRDGTLTRLLKHALGGNSHTLMVACISPCDAHAEENASTLAYATRARAISNTPVVNVDPHAAQVAALKAEIRELKAEIARLHELLSLSGVTVSADLALTERSNTSVSPELSVASSNALLSEADKALVSMTPPVTTVTASDANPTVGLAKGEKSDAVNSALGQRLVKGVQLAKQLAKSNEQLRKAFDSLAEHREELERANALLTTENMALQEKVTLYELAVAMESYPSAPPSSMAAQIEQQLRKAARDLIALRDENTSLKDQLAAANLTAAPIERKLPSRESSARAAVKGPRAPPRSTSRRPSNGGSPSATYGGHRAEAAYGSTRADCHSRGGSAGNGQHSAEPVAAADSRISLSTTGELLLGHAWAPPPPTAGSLRSEPKTVARLMPTTSTFDELDQLSALLRKRAEMARPSTAAGMRQF